MVLGMPLEYFAREVLRVVAYAALAIVCAERWRAGAWARVGALTGVLGAVLAAYQLLSWLLYANDQPLLMDLRADVGLDRVLYWLDLVVLAGLAAAVVLGRERTPRPVADEPAGAPGTPVP